MRPRDLKFSETHEWIKTEGAEAVIGITDYAVAQLSDLVSVELPHVGDAVEVESPMGEIESVKTVADLIAPVAGKVTAVNKEVVDDIEVLTQSPYEDGWLVRIKMKDPKDLDHLMSAKDYDEFLKGLKEEEEEEEEDDEDDEETAE